MKDEILLELKRKVWRPSKTSKSLVVTLPDVAFLKVGDVLKLKITTDRKIIIEK